MDTSILHSTDTPVSSDNNAERIAALVSECLALRQSLQQANAMLVRIENAEFSFGDLGGWPNAMEIQEVINATSAAAQARSSAATELTQEFRKGALTGWNSALTEAAKACEALRSSGENADDWTITRDRAMSECVDLIKSKRTGVKAAPASDMGQDHAGPDCDQDACDPKNCACKQSRFDAGLAKLVAEAPAQQLRYAVNALRRIADGEQEPAKHAVVAVKHILGPLATLTPAEPDGWTTRNVHLSSSPVGLYFRNEQNDVDAIRLLGSQTTDGNPSYEIKPFYYAASIGLAE